MHTPVAARARAPAACRPVAAARAAPARVLPGGRPGARLVVKPRPCRTRALPPLAMVNVDFSPALVLGAGLVGGGLALYQLRRMRPTLSRDFDVVVSSIAIFSGGILVFQGWRLDPLLLFCQLLTAGMALSFAVEALRLREEVEDATAAAPPLDPRAAAAPPPRVGRGAAPLPPPRPGGDAYYDRWQGDGGVWLDDSGDDRYYTPPPADAYYTDAAAGPSPGYYDDRAYGSDGYGSDGRGGGATGSYGDAYWSPPPPASGPPDWGGYGDAPPPAGGGGGVDVGVGARPAAAPDDDWE